ncbi:MAG: OadG family protein [Bacteroidales bacterium]|nr:OadG family protein [Bacteroidales bacterium]
MLNNLNYITQQVESGSSDAADDICVFAQNDPYGALMAILGMGFVFLVLLLLYAVFSNTPRIYSPEFKAWLNSLWSRRKLEKAPEGEEDTKASKPEDLSGEVNAAIAAAIHLYRSELHDYENTILTINKVSRTYSPWSSKIYGLRNIPKN